jgi:hypothetical protein
MTSHANGRPGPGPGLGGTGQIADDLYLIAHHEVSGKPHLQPRALGLGLAGALLAELILTGTITVTTAAVTATGHARAGDQLTQRIADQMAAEPQQHRVDTWLAFLGRTAAADVAARLAHAGYLARASARRTWRGHRWIPVDPDCAFAPITRVSVALNPSSATVTGVTLAGLATACGLGPRLSLYLPDGARDRTDTWVTRLHPDLREVITHTQAAVDSALLAHRV